MRRRRAADFSVLPEGCVSIILSFTSPRDACRLSLVSTVFRSAAESDEVWEKFLPPDWEEIVSRSFSNSPVVFSSKKDLYFRLCDHPILIDDGRKSDDLINAYHPPNSGLRRQSFGLEKLTGKKCYMLGARELLIAWGETPHSRRWRSEPESRFSEVAEILVVWWLSISGTLGTRFLSPKTTYAAYFVFKLADCAYSFDVRPVAVFVRLLKSEKKSGHIWSLDPEGKARLQQPMVRSASNILRLEHEKQQPRKRGDGWMEIEMCEFFNDPEEDEAVKMSLIEYSILKSGFVVEGIELRPKEKSYSEASLCIQVLKSSSNST